MPTDADIARWRLRGQHLTDGSRRTGAAAVVSSLLAVQAENPAQSAWAVASRTRRPDPSDLDDCLTDARVIRTHVLRPTWHYVAAADLVWLLELTAPRVRPTIERQLGASAGLRGGGRGRAEEVVVDALSERQLTRQELADRLTAAGHSVTGFDLMLLLVHLELQAIVCSGAPVDGVHRYALVADRVPSPRRLDREEALAELVLRYVASHGPATERDLSYWATLTVTDVRAGLAAFGDRLASFEHDGRRYWHDPRQEPPAGAERPAAHLLQLLDEMYRGYQDSRMVLDAAGVVPRGREQQVGMTLVDGQLVAGMKRNVTEPRVRFELHPHASWSDRFLPEVEEAAAAYGAFLRREPEVVLVR